MKSLKELTDRLKHGPSDCTGIDIGSTAIKLVRLRGSGSDVTLVGAEILEPSVTNLSIPPRLRARHAAIAVSGTNAVAKLLTFPGAADAGFEGRLHKSLGVAEEDDFRISYRVISEGQGRAESRALAVALPQAEADPVMQHFASGIPAPYSLEIAPLATLTAFEHGPVAANPDQAMGLIDFGTARTTLSFFHRGALVLMRQFDFGSRDILQRGESTLHVDTETAQGILVDSAFDISELLGELMSPVTTQFVVSRDFVERRDNCSDIALFAIGGIALSRATLGELEQTLSTDIAGWNPFDNLNVQTQSVDDRIGADSWRFASAIGAALSALEDA